MYGNRRVFWTARVAAASDRKYASAISFYSLLSPLLLWVVCVIIRWPVYRQWSFPPFISLLHREKHFSPHYYWYFKFTHFSFYLWFFVIFPFVKVFFFQFNPSILICIYNIFRFDHSTFDFLFFFFCQSFYGFKFYPSNKVYDFSFFNSYNNFKFVILLFISFFFPWLFF
jgi:hypothetical protein